MELSATVTPVNEDEGRKRLARAVAVDRARIFGTVDRARIMAGVSRGTWDKVEAGGRVRDYSLASIEKALDWPPGRAMALIHGDESGGVASPPSAPASGLRQSVEEAELPAGIKRAMLALLDSVDDHGGGPPSGEHREGVRGA